MAERVPPSHDEEFAHSEVEEAADERAASAGRALELLSSQRAFAWALVVALFLVGFSLLWLASETHYRSCVEAISVSSQNDDSDLARLARRTGVDNCSRSPF